MKNSTPMRRSNIGYTLASVALVFLTLQACVTRIDGLDNLNVITKPYSVHFADSMGLIHQTYDGERIVPINGTDNYPVEALNTTGGHILMVKQGGTILFADDAGEGENHNFNPSYKDINPNAFGPTMMINLPDYTTVDSTGETKDRIYIASGSAFMAFNDDNAAVDSPWQTINGPNNDENVRVTSFTRLADDRLVAFDNGSRGLWIKPDNATPWTAVAASGLPAAGGGDMYIVHQNNDILAVMLGLSDPDGGIWRSTDGGANFTKLPKVITEDGDVPVITCADAPFGKVVVVGTQDQGIIRFDGFDNRWTHGNGGLKEGTSINAIAYHYNKFKNDKVGEYIYIATTTGVYRSDDLGQNWIPLEVNSQTNIFTAIH